MTPPIASDYYVYKFAHGYKSKYMIDLSRGLGKFLMNYGGGLLKQRILLPEHDQFKPLPGRVYRRYRFHSGTFRFEHDLQFMERNVSFMSVKNEHSHDERVMLLGEKIIRMQDLGIYNESGDLTTFLTWRSTDK
jgi:hypothetical protein